MADFVLPLLGMGGGSGMGGSMMQPTPQVAPQPTETPESPLDQIIRGALANPQPADAQAALESPDKFIERRMNEMVYGSAEPTKKSRAMAFLTNMLAGAAVGDKYVSPQTRARANAMQEYRLATEGQRAQIAEQRNQQQQLINLINQARMTKQGEEMNAYRQQLAEIAQQKAEQGRIEGERKAARDRVLNLKDLAGLDTAQRQTRLKERMFEYEKGAIKGRPEEVLMEAVQRLGNGEMDEADFKVVFDAYSKINEDRLKLKATGAPHREPVGSFQAITDDDGTVIGYFNPTKGTLVNPPIEGGRRGAVPGTIRERSALRRNMIEDLGTLEGLAGRNRGSIGRIFGNYAAAKRWLVGAGPEVNDMFRISDNIGDQLLRARSGASINEAEYQRLRSLVPDPRGPEEKFFTDLKSLKNEIERLEDKMELKKQGGAPYAGGGRGPIAPAQQTAPATPPAPTRRFSGGKRIP